MKTAIIIPASAKSSRLPRKPLLDDTGKPLVLHTYEAALQSKLADEVWIAADMECFTALERLSERDSACNEVRFMLADGDFRNGTQRVAWAANDLQKCGIGPFDIIVNLQVDEPLVTGEMLDKLITRMQTRLPGGGLPGFATLVSDRSCRGDGAVFAAVDEGRCLYFSRAPMIGAFRHIGCYAFSRWALDRVQEMPRSLLSEAENLEQIQWISDGKIIWAVSVDRAPLSINTRADYDQFVELMRQPV